MFHVANFTMKWFVFLLILEKKGHSMETSHFLKNVNDVRLWIVEVMMMMNLKSQDDFVPCND